MTDSLAARIESRFPEHRGSAEALLGLGFRPMFWDEDDGWLVYVAVAVRALAYVQVDADKTTTRTVALSALAGLSKTVEADATTLTLQAAPPVGVLTLRSTTTEGRAQLSALHQDLCLHLCDPPPVDVRSR